MPDADPLLSLADPDRVAAVSAYAVLDTPPEPAFDDAARLAAQVCGTPVAFVTFVDGRRPFVKAAVGTDGGLRDAPLSDVFAPAVVAAGRPLEIPDAAADPAYAAHPAVTGPAAVRFCAGTPLAVPSGHVVGCLCVVDRVPRTLTAEQRAALDAVGRQVVTLLELRRELARSTAVEGRFRAAFDQTLMGMVETDFAGRVIQANAAFCRLVGRSPEQLVGRTSRDYTPADDTGRDEASIATVGQGRSDRFGYDKRYVRPDGTIVWARVTAAPVRDADGRPASLIAAVEDVTDRRAAKAALVDSRQRYQQAVDGAGLGTFHWTLPVGPDTVYDWNATLKGFFWQPPDAVCGPAVRERTVHPDDLPRIRAGIAAAIAGGAQYDEQYRLVGPAGQLRWIHARGRASGGDPAAGVPHTRFGGIVMDVTDARAAADALRDSEAHFRRLADAMPQIVWAAAPDGTVDYYNRRWFEYVGVATAVEPPPWEQHVHPDDRAAAAAAWAASVSTGEPYGVEFRLRDGRGEHRWFLVRAVPVRDDPAGRPTRWVGTCTDVDERRRLQADRERQAEQRQMALDAACMGWWRVDGATNDVIGDDRFGAIFGLPPGVNRLPYDRAVASIHDEDRDRVNAAVRAAVDPVAPVPYTIEYRTVHPDGSVRWAMASGRAYWAGEGADRHYTDFVGTIADVTDRKAAEAERVALLQSEREARAEAERQSAVKDEFLATLSHELRTPLNAILGWSQILNGDLADGQAIDRADLVDGLATIERNARAQRQIVDDLLDMSRVVAGKLRMDVQPVDLPAVVRAAIATVTPAATAKGVRVQPVLDEAVGPVTGDPNRLQQVFWNLISNAVKFTPKGGRVQVLLQRVNSHVEVAVTDTGQGIDGSFLPHVFERFRQADGGPTRRQGGLGLGLSIVKQLVELHGGAVRVASGGVGQGATFTVELPLTVVHPPTEPEATPREHPRSATVQTPAAIDACGRLQGVRVLVVDDEPDARGLVRRVLAGCGADVALAGSAAEAMALLVAGPPPAVLVSDIGMPDADGYDLIRDVRLLPPDRGGTVPAVALTAYARPIDRVRVLEAGYQMHATKPVDADELVVIVASLAGRTGR